MENAVDALKIAFAVFIFVIALSVTMYMFTMAKTTSDLVLQASDVTEYMEYTELEDIAGSNAMINNDRIVGLETIIPTLYKYYKENYTVVFRNSNGTPMDLYTTQTNPELWSIGYTNKYYVCVELGLQTANEETGNLINRCYTNYDFTKAVELLNKYNIDVVTHIMVGLPNESIEDIKKTTKFINMYNIQGLKIHSCYVVKNTVLEKLYSEGEYFPLELDEYFESCVYILTHINPNIVIHRISGDAPKDLLVAPNWNSHKKWIINGLDKFLKENDLYQGMYYKK